jgi:hypothetical protein
MDPFPMVFLAQDAGVTRDPQVDFPHAEIHCTFAS